MKTAENKFSKKINDQNNSPDLLQGSSAFRTFAAGKSYTASSC